MSANDEKQKYIDGLRDLADWLADNDVPEPQWGWSPSLPTAMLRLRTVEDMAAFARFPGEVEKQAWGNGDPWYRLYRRFGPAVLEAYIGREEVCERTQVGTRHVEAQPERDEPVYEWECKPILEATVGK